MKEDEESECSEQKECWLVGEHGDDDTEDEDVYDDDDEDDSKQEEVQRLEKLVPDSTLVQLEKYFRNAKRFVMLIVQHY